MNPYSTILEAICDLIQKGYDEDFDLQPRFLECRRGTIQLAFHDVKIDQVFRFAFESEASDERFLYAISSEKFQIKGLLVCDFEVVHDHWVHPWVEKVLC